MFVYHYKSGTYAVKAPVMQNLPNRSVDFV